MIITPWPRAYSALRLNCYSRLTYLPIAEQGSPSEHTAALANFCSFEGDGGKGLIGSGGSVGLLGADAWEM